MHGRIARNNRQFINTILGIFHTGAPWKDLPPECNNWNNTYKQFSRWKQKEIWKKLLEIFVQDLDFEWLTIDPIFIKVHLQAAGA